MIYNVISNGRGSYDCTLHLVQRQREVLLCRYVLQHHSQLSFILHCGVYVALHLHKHRSQSPQTRFVFVCVCLYKKECIMCGADFSSYPGLQRVPVLYLGIKLPGVKGQLHLSQEAVVPEPVVVPHGHLQGSSLQLRVADHVLCHTGNNVSVMILKFCIQELLQGY